MPEWKPITAEKCLGLTYKHSNLLLKCLTKLMTFSQNIPASTSSSHWYHAATTVKCIRVKRKPFFVPGVHGNNCGEEKKIEISDFLSFRVKIWSQWVIHRECIQKMPRSQIFLFLAKNKRSALGVSTVKVQNGLARLASTVASSNLYLKYLNI